MSVLDEMLERAKRRLAPQIAQEQNNLMAAREQGEAIRARDSETTQTWSPPYRRATREEDEAHYARMKLEQEALDQARWELEGKQIDPKTGRKIYTGPSSKDF